MDGTKTGSLPMRFACTQCSRCCRHEGGYVFLTPEDLETLARHLAQSVEQTIERYCRWVPFGAEDQLSLREQANVDCIFWKDGGCSVYEGRPVQCRTYPFWPHVAEDTAAWRREAEECPGIGIGPAYTPEDVRRLVAARAGRSPVTRSRGGAR
jgi:Fe-S-cluster containining protein